MTGINYKYSEEDGRSYIQSVQDITPILDANKRALADNKNARFSRPMNKVASIPLIVIEKWWNEKGIDLMNDHDAMRQFLNDPDNRAFRTMGGKL